MKKKQGEGLTYFNIEVFYWKGREGEMVAEQSNHVNWTSHKSEQDLWLSFLSMKSINKVKDIPTCAPFNQLILVSYYQPEHVTVGTIIVILCNSKDINTFFLWYIYH